MKNRLAVGVALGALLKKKVAQVAKMMMAALRSTPPPDLIIVKMETTRVSELIK